MPMRCRGFTLIELVITVAIVSLLATSALPLGKMMTQRMKEAELRSALRDLRTGIDAYKRATEEGRIDIEVDSTGYPASLNLLVEGSDDAKDPKKAKLHYMRRLPRDPFFPDSSAKAVDTWGLRSYKSSASDPQPGEDVYDIYSLAKGVGLNGIPYRQW
jgi:general secretion pathway protein G